MYVFLEVNLLGGVRSSIRNIRHNVNEDEIPQRTRSYHQGNEMNNVLERWREEGEKKEDREGEEVEARGGWKK